MAFARTAPGDAYATLAKWQFEFKKHARKPLVLFGFAVVLVMSVVVYFWPSEVENGTDKALVTQLGANTLSTGPVSGGQVANNIINNFYGSAPTALREFSEDPATPITFSIGCMTFRPIGELLTSINSGKPTPFLSAQRADAAEPTPLISLYVKDGAIWADITLYSPQQKYNAFALRGTSFRKIAPNWDVNASNRAIEVVNENGVPILQLVRSSNSHLRIDGLFRAENSILFLGRGDTSLAITKGLEAKSYNPPPNFLPRLFRYPSSEYPREMVEPLPPRPPCTASSQGIMAISAGIVLPL